MSSGSCFCIWVSIQSKRGRVNHLQPGGWIYICPCCHWICTNLKFVACSVASAIWRICCVGRKSERWYWVKNCYIQIWTEFLNDSGWCNFTNHVKVELKSKILRKIHSICHRPLPFQNVVTNDASCIRINPKLPCACAVLKIQSIKRGINSSSRGNCSSINPDEPVWSRVATCRRGECVSWVFYGTASRTSLNIAVIVWVKICSRVYFYSSKTTINF